MTKDFEYSGTDNLEAMAFAKNYNKYLISLVENELEQGKKYKILDFGAGTGTYADMMKSNKQLVIDCLEPDRELQKRLQKNNYKTFTDVKDLSKNNYDLIYSFNVFEHIEDDVQVFSKLVESLRPGGVIVVYVPAFNLLFSSMDKKVEHFRRYDKKRLKLFAESNSYLENPNIYYCDPIGFFAALAFRIIGNENGTISPSSVKLFDTYLFPISKAIQFFTKNLFGKNAVLIVGKSQKIDV